MRWFRREEPPEERPVPLPPPEHRAPTTPPAVPTPEPSVPPAADSQGADSAAAEPVDAVADQVVLPVTRDRIARSLRGQGYRFRIGEDGAISGNWDGCLFTIGLVGPAAAILQVRGTWNRTIDAELAPGIAHVVNDWNRDRIWPKVYTRPGPAGLQAYAEVSIDVAGGATDAQIAEFLACGLGTGVQYFTYLGDLLTVEDSPSGLTG